MKYLKTFEKNYYSLKKYIIVDNFDKFRNKNVYTIFEILKINNSNGLDVKRLYWCEEDSIKEEDATYYNQKFKLKDIKYTSDNIEECLEYVKYVLFKSNKYNL